MSILSSIIAENNNELKDKWVKQLKEALEHAKKYNQFEILEETIQRIENFYFTE